MAILKIARMGHPVLLQKCEPVAAPGAPEIRRGLSGLKCRCGTHMSILRAVKRAAQA